MTARFAQLQELREMVLGFGKHLDQGKEILVHWGGERLCGVCSCVARLI